MTAQPAAGTNLRGPLGRVMVGVGAAVLALDVLPLALHWQDALDRPANYAFELLMACGLGALHAAQQLFLQPGGLLPAVRHLLISCWPILLIAAGSLLLLTKRGETTSNEARSNAPSPVQSGGRS